MKKALSFSLIIIIVLIFISACAQIQGQQKIENKTITASIDNDTDNTIVLQSSDVKNAKSNATTLKNYMYDGGIIIVDNESTQIKDNICEELDMPIEPEFCYAENQSKPNTRLSKRATSTTGQDIVTLYYNYGDGLSGVYVINAQTEVSADEKEKLITEAVHEIQAMQNTNTQYLERAATGSEKTLGSFTVVSTRLPKGKLKAIYTFYTVQDYNGKDYYIVKTEERGIPGAYLASSDSNYKSKYVGKSLKTLIKTTTDSVSAREYGPHRTPKVQNYTVSVGGAFSAVTGSTFNANVSYSKSMPDTDIEASATTKLAEWDVTLKSKAQKKSMDFVPAVTFDCPKAKASVHISCSSKYVVDSWDTAKETLSVSRQVTCTPSKCS